MRSDTQMPDRPKPAMLAILTALPRAVIVVDENRRVVMANAMAEEFFQMGASVLARQNLSDIVPFASPLFALVENYPTLRSNENVKQLQEELTSTENKISFARQFYNDIATKFNISQQVFPANFIASMFNFKPAELFEIQVAAEREVPTVNLSLKK